VNTDDLIALHLRLECKEITPKGDQSSRENESAAEAWVRTLPAYRRRGLARRVTAAWATHAWAQGKVPFYSHRMDNLASQRAARTLGLAPFIVDAAYS
jgi:predicted GNAT family acetyltransferase